MSEAGETLNHVSTESPNHVRARKLICASVQQQICRKYWPGMSFLSEFRGEYIPGDFTGDAGPLDPPVYFDPLGSRTLNYDPEAVLQTRKHWAQVDYAYAASEAFVCSLNDTPNIAISVAWTATSSYAGVGYVPVTTSYPFDGGSAVVGVLGTPGVNMSCAPTGTSGSQSIFNARGIAGPLSIPVILMFQASPFGLSMGSSTTEWGSDTENYTWGTITCGWGAVDLTGQPAAGSHLGSGFTNSPIDSGTLGPASFTAVMSGEITFESQLSILTTALGGLNWDYFNENPMATSKTWGFDEWANIGSEPNDLTVSGTTDPSRFTMGLVDYVTGELYGGGTVIADEVHGDVGGPMGIDYVNIYPSGMSGFSPNLEDELWTGWLWPNTQPTIFFGDNNHANPIWGVRTRFTNTGNAPVHYFFATARVIDQPGATNTLADVSVIKDGLRVYPGDTVEIPLFPYNPGGGISADKDFVATGGRLSSGWITFCIVGESAFDWHARTGF